LIPCGLGVLYETNLTMYSLVSTGKYLLSTAGTKRLILGVLPHSLLEISAILLSIVLAALLSKAVTRCLLGLLSKKRRQTLQVLKTEILQIFKIVIFVELPLIWVSAGIEEMITARLI